VPINIENGGSILLGVHDVVVPDFVV